MNTRDDYIICSIIILETLQRKDKAEKDSSSYNNKQIIRNKCISLINMDIIQESKELVHKSKESKRYSMG